jgi:hypothetical protein
VIVSKISVLLIVAILVTLVSGCTGVEDGNGNGNGDTTPPVISNISVTDITATSASIIWTTDEPASSQVEYGLNSSYGSSSAFDNSLVENHAILLNELSTDTTYHYSVRSKDGSGNEEISQDYTFTTASLAAYWSPVWYQDTDDTNYDADYITNFDFDGDWTGANNWENQPDYPLPCYIYYWMIETDTHWFIGYADFHPRDWTDFPLIDTQHENDMEGCILVIGKDGSPYGQLLLIITVAHLDFYSYKDFDASPSANVADGHETIDGDVQFEDHHPYVYVEAKGHGVYGDKRWEESDFPGGDGVIYRYTGIADEPQSGNTRDVGYALVAIDELWNRRDNSDTFHEFGTFKGDTTPGVLNMTENAANAPWGWDDWNDGDVDNSDFFLNPAYLVDYYHDGLRNFSLSYDHHPYI